MKALVYLVCGGRLCSCRREFIRWPQRQIHRGFRSFVSQLGKVVSIVKPLPMKDVTETRYHYIYTLCIVVEADFQDESLYRNSQTMRMCLTRLFTYNGCPSGLSSTLERFLAKEKDAVKVTKGSQTAITQIINVELIDQNKIPFTKEENEEADIAVQDYL